MIITIDQIEKPLIINHIAKPKPNQSKAKGFVSPIKPILYSSLSLLYYYSSRQFIQPELRQQPTPNQSPAKAKAKTLVKQNQLFMKIHE